MGLFCGGLFMFQICWNDLMDTQLTSTLKTQGRTAYILNCCLQAFNRTVFLKWSACQATSMSPSLRLKAASSSWLQNWPSPCDTGSNLCVPIVLAFLCFLVEIIKKKGKNGTLYRQLVRKVNVWLQEVNRWIGWCQHEAVVDCCWGEVAVMLSCGWDDIGLRRASHVADHNVTLQRNQEH